MSRLDQIRQFLEGTPFAGAELTPLAGDASFRRYVRAFKDNKRAMVMDAPPEREDVRPFMAIANYIHDAGFSAPEVLASDVESGFLLLEDLDDMSFTRKLREAQGAAKEAMEAELYEAAIDVLVRWHDAQDGFSNPTALPLPLYDETLLLREVQLFSDWYLPQIYGKEKALSLKSEYMGIWKTLLSQAKLATNQFVHRDYHADNLMWLPARDDVRKVGLLDFQDGVYGDAAYDMVSLLEDARRDVPPALAKQMIERYLAATGTDRDAFLLAYALLGAQRNSKIIGIFSRLAARDGKHHYLDYLPRVWKHLEQDVTHPLLAPLKAWLDTHVEAKWRGVITITHDARALVLSA